MKRIKGRGGELLSKALAEVRSAGGDVSATVEQGKHLKLRIVGPAGRSMVTLSRTPSDPRSDMNHVACVRRAIASVR